MLEREDKSKDQLLQEIDQLKETVSYLQGQLVRESAVHEKRFELEKLITHISSEFINIKPDQIDSAIKRTLEIIADTICADRGCIFRFSDDLSAFSMTHEWCRKGIRSLAGRIEHFNIETFPWFVEKIKSFETLRIPRVSGLCHEAENFKNLLQRLSIRSVICIPMLIEGQLVGFAGFDCVLYENQWSDDVVDLMKVAVIIFSNALEQEKRSQALRWSRQWLQLVLDSIPIGVFWKDYESIYTGCNIRFARDAGFDSTGQIIGKTDYDLVWTKEESDFFREYDRKVMDSDTPEFGIIEPYKRPDGSSAWAETNKIPLHDENGKVVGILGTYKDITGIKQTEEAIRSLIEATSGKFGEQFVEAMVFRLAEIVGADCAFVGQPCESSLNAMETKYILLDGEISENFIFGLEGTPSANVIKGTACIYPEKVTDIFPEDHILQEMNIQGYVGVPLYDLKDRPNGIMTALFRNPIGMPEFSLMILQLFAGRVSAELERMKVEEERERLLKILTAKNEELQSIVYVGSHDLRTPLVNIQGFAGELGICCKEITECFQRADMPEDIRSYLSSIITEDIPLALGFIDASVTKMESLLDGLLRLSRIGSSVLEVTRIDMGELINDVLAAMRYQIEQSEAELIVEDLPACVADPDQINQVFSNLLDNALKYLRDDRRGRITVSGKIEGKEAIYRVEDNGIGVDSTFLENIFEIFQRLEPSGPVKGQGLGLTIVKRIVVRNNGRVWVESEHGRGSRFFVALPVK